MGFVVPPSAPFLGCSPDAVVVDDNKLIEIKCPISGKDSTLEVMLKKLKWIDIINNNYEVKKKACVLWSGTVRHVPHAN